MWGRLMKVNDYKGFEIWCERQEALGGWDNIYFYIMRISDGWFLEDSFSDGSDNVRSVLKFCKDMVDSYLKHPGDFEDNEEDLETLESLNAKDE